MSRRPSPREFRDWELPAPADIWLRIGLVLAKRKYWVGNWITIGVLIFSFILNMECFLGTFGDALTADIALLEVDFFFGRSPDEASEFSMDSTRVVIMLAKVYRCDIVQIAIRLHLSKMLVGKKCKGAPTACCMNHGSTVYQQDITKGKLVSYHQKIIVS